MKQKLKLVADPYPPYQFIDHGEIVGVDHDLVKTAFQLSGIEIEVNLHSWDDCIELMETGEVDGLFQITPTPDREEQFAFSKLMRTAQTVYLGNSSSNVILSHFASHAEILTRHSLGLVEGYAYHPEVDELDNKQKTFYSSQEALLQALSHKDIDLALMDIGVAKHLSNGLGLDNIIVLPGHAIERKLHVAFQKILTELVNLFNQGLESLDQQGLRPKTYARYNLTA